MVSPATAAAAPPRHGDAPSSLSSSSSSGPASTTTNTTTTTTNTNTTSLSDAVGTTTSSSSAAAAPPPDAPTRRRRQAPGSEKTAAGADVMRDRERAGLLGRPPPAASWAARNQWVVLALASGACAAFNGVFAKLTTNSLTSHISLAITGALRLEHYEGAFEIVFRGMFFGLNLAFNGVMWTLFTKALARGSSTTQVSIMNTSANFVITALLGLAIFAENLPPLWWLGAALLVAGNVIIGRKDDGGGDDDARHGPSEPSEPAPPEPSASPRPADGGIAAYGAVPQVDTLRPASDEPKDEDVPLIGDVETVA